MTTQASEKTPSRAVDLSRRGGGVTRFLNSVADAGLAMVGMRRDQTAARQSYRPDFETACDDLLSTLGEAAGTAMARRVMNSYHALDDADKLLFFKLLRQRYHLDFEAIHIALNKVRDTGSNSDLALFLELAEPRRQELFRRLNMAPNGTRSLVDMRSSLLTFLQDHPDLRPVDADLEHLFSSWFNRGFLNLSCIGWDTPAAVLEKLIQYETVHEMRGWDDLRRRLAADRRCFAFFHTALPDDPLVFVEVALVKGIAREIAPIIMTDRTESNPADADTAIFYSINNCLDGLRGISFGNFLIKQVVMELASELPHLQAFATLSPIPGFRSWMEKHVLIEQPPIVLNDDERRLLRLLETEGWMENTEVCSALEPLLTELLAIYLVQVKSGDDPKDPVARFHLRNGARLDSLNWLSDLSAERMRQSYGFMVNYVYDPDTIEKNHELYIQNNEVVTSVVVGALAGRERFAEAVSL